MDYLIDTNVISELRKIKSRQCNHGVQTWYQAAIQHQHIFYLSWMTIGELYAGVFQCRRRHDEKQASILEAWIKTIEENYENRLLPLSSDIIKIWGAILWPQDQHPIDKLIAATAMAHRLTVVTRNTHEFMNIDVAILNPFS